MNNHPIRFYLPEVMDDDNPDIEGSVEFFENGIGIGFGGHGHCEMEPGYTTVIWIEQHHGQVQINIWADITQGDPTHQIKLWHAREEQRLPDEALRNDPATNFVHTYPVPEQGDA